MPIHLPPITRRRFIATSLAAGAALALRPNAWAARRPLDRHAWALLADTHIAADPALIARDINMTDQFQTVAKELIGLERRPAGVLINGDCAYNRGARGDYEALTKLLEPVRRADLPIHLALGNHDDRNHFRALIAEAKDSAALLPDKHVAILKSARANWFLLDSLDQVNVTPGLLGEMQLKWLARALDKHADRPALVFAHHNLMFAPEQTGALRDTDQLLAVLRPRKHVKAYIFGHTHNWSVTTDESGIHLINLPTTAYTFRPEMAKGWVLAHLERDGMWLELRCIDRAHPQHAQTVDLKWRTV